MGITAVAAVATAASGAYAANRANKSAGKARGAAMRLEGRQDYYNDLLMDLMKNPDKIFDDPGYQESFNQGIQAVERSSAARGFTGSGNAAVALQRFGQSFAKDYLRDEKNFLAGLSGVQQSAAPYYGMASADEARGTDAVTSAFASLGYLATSGGMDGKGFGGSSGTPASNYSYKDSSSGQTIRQNSSGYIVNM